MAKDKKVESREPIIAGASANREEALRPTRALEPRVYDVLCVHDQRSIASGELRRSSVAEIKRDVRLIITTDYASVGFVLERNLPCTGYAVKISSTYSRTHLVAA